MTTIPSPCKLDGAGRSTDLQGALAGPQVSPPPPSVSFGKLTGPCGLSVLSSVHYEKSPFEDGHSQIQMLSPQNKELSPNSLYGQIASHSLKE